MSRLREAIETALGRAPVSIQPLSGGCVAEVYKVCLPDNSILVAKVDYRQPARIDCEGMMLSYLARHSRLPVPAIIHCAAGLLLMEFIQGDSEFSAAAQQHAAEQLAALHSISAPGFGLEIDTLIGGLHQPNPWTPSWLEFFAQQRLLYMGKQAVEAGRMPHGMLARLEKLTGRLDRWLSEPAQSSLIHGDAWTTNILAREGRISGFIDPAIYYADAEIELAFTTLFGTFGAPFFRRYNELRPILPGFIEARRDIYNLYPLLVHVRLFGGSYLYQVDSQLKELGC